MDDFRSHNGSVRYSKIGCRRMHIFKGPGYLFLSPGCVFITFLTMYNADGKWPKSHWNMTFLLTVQTGTFLCFPAGRSLATRSSASDLTVSLLIFDQRHMHIPRDVPTCKGKQERVVESESAFFHRFPALAPSLRMAVFINEQIFPDSCLAWSSFITHLSL